MTYSANLEKEGISSQYLAVLKPRRFLDSTAWSLVSVTIYSQSFDYGEIINLSADDSELTAASTAALSDGDFYYDGELSVLYVDVGGDPSGYEIVATYEMYFGTFDAHFFRSPLDNTSRVVYWEPVIVRSPRIRSSSTDALFGFMPTGSSQIVMSNLTHLFERHVYDSSFSGADVDLYHYLGKLTIANTKLIYRGICRGVSYDDSEVSFNLYDRNDIFNEEYRPDFTTKFYTTSTFSGLDPLYENRPVRKVYGVVDGFVPVNIDYVGESPTTSDNRDWICIGSHTNLGSISANILASPSSTTTRTYLDSADGLRVGDSVHIDSSAGSASDRYAEITTVNKTGDHYIEHASTGLAAATASVVKRSFVGNIVVFKNGVAYKPQFGRDYTEYTDSTNSVSGFSFTTTMESNLSIGATLETSDVVYCRVYGNTNQVTLGGSPLGSDSSNTGNLTSAVVILFDLLKNLGILESEIDTATFSSLEAAVSDELGFAIPELSGNDFPIYKDLITNITLSILAKIYLDDDNKWTVFQTGPLGAVDKSIEDDEILLNTLSYNLEFLDIISDVVVGYASREFSPKHQQSGFFSSVSDSSTIAKRLHKISKQQTFISYHFIESEAQTLATRLMYALGDRKGVCSFSTKNRFYNTELGSNVKITRTRLPGFEYSSETTRERDFSVEATDKGLSDIQIELNDQKGIEDAAGSW